ncbi:mitochondrial carrier, partial [Hesseltinella vesiculosa]
KVRLQTQPLDRPYYKGPWHCLKATIQHEGFFSLYKGMSLPMAGAMVENATLFVGYRQIQRVIRLATDNLDESQPLPMGQLVLAGAGAGSLASLVLTPVELVKCKLQIQNTNDSLLQRYQGPKHVIQHVLHQHGPLGFYRGFLPTLIRETGGAVFWFGLYEYTCHLFLQRRHSQSKKDLSPLELMLAGAMGGIGYNVSLFPIDSVKSHMQTEEKLRPRVPTGSFAQEGGVRGFY